MMIFILSLRMYIICVGGPLNQCIYAPDAVNENLLLMCPFLPQGVVTNNIR